MRKKETIPGRLFPSQPRIIPKKYSEIKKKLGLNNPYQPIPVLEFQNGFIMLDHHNSASFLLYERNESLLNIEIQESDLEALFYFKGAFTGIMRIQDFIEKYEKEFRPRCEKLGVFDCWDLKPPIMNEKRRNYFY